MAKLPKAIIKKYGITKKAWQVFRSRKGKANKPKTRNRSVGRHMAKKRNSRRRGFLSFGTLAKFVKVGALVGPAAARFMSTGSTEDKIKMTVRAYTGFNMYNYTWEPSALAEGWMPYIATSLIVTGIQKLNGIIRRL